MDRREQTAETNSMIHVSDDPAFWGGKLGRLDFAVCLKTNIGIRGSCSPLVVYFYASVVQSAGLVVDFA